MGSVRETGTTGEAGQAFEGTTDTPCCHWQEDSLAGGLGRASHTSFEDISFSAHRQASQAP